MAKDPPLDIELTPLTGKARSLREWITTFHLVFAALDPYSMSGRRILRTADRILSNFDQADCRVAWLVAGNATDATRLLGEATTSKLTFIDPDRTIVKAFGLERLPALVHVGAEGKIVNASEGWHPYEWREVTANLARLMSWSAPLIPAPGDPAEFEGSPAA